MTWKITSITPHTDHLTRVGFEHEGLPYNALFENEGLVGALGELLQGEWQVDPRCSHPTDLTSLWRDRPGPVTHPYSTLDAWFQAKADIQRRHPDHRIVYLAGEADADALLRDVGDPETITIPSAGNRLMGTLAGDVPTPVEILSGGLIAPERILGALKDKNRHEE